MLYARGCAGLPNKLLKHNSTLQETLDERERRLCAIPYDSYRRQLALNEKKSKYTHYVGRLEDNFLVHAIRCATHFLFEKRARIRYVARRIRLYIQDDTGIRRIKLHCTLDRIET